MSENTPILSVSEFYKCIAHASPGTPKSECYALYQHIKWRHSSPIRVIEIGSSYGRGTISLALACPPGSEVLTFDPYSGMSNFGNRADSSVALAWERNLRHARLNYIHREVDVQRYMLFSTDQEAVRIVRQGRPLPTFTFIDGHHIYKTALHDYTHFVRPFAKAGSTCALHDYTAKFPGIVRLVNELTMHSRHTPDDRWRKLPESFGNIVFLEKIDG